ncbi:cupin domain-containing protein [Microvirga pudoricolor]|uniref:cupin domain-containing protein n=1 Tax=Microvirga pudoricolor TaxID=2778729 RepID=UPI001950AC46|nr:cupin domain-containing protein [Microvirga pudoricolor]MBM6593003.1 cupin domain-containing protein [Microvirga pudoricolor]
MEAAQQDIVQIGELKLHFRLCEPGATVFEFVVPPRARVPAPHYHQEADEILYGLEGTLNVTVDSTTRDIGPGDVIFIPRARVHHHQNLSDGIARTLVMITPGTIGRDYFAELAEAVNAPGKPDLGRVQDIMLRHGLVPA